MKRKSREINIFSMSSLDLFASALGAFMLISLISLPYYLKTDNVTEETRKAISEQEKQSLQDQVKKLQDKNEQLSSQIQSNGPEISRQLEQCNAELNEAKQCIELMEDTFLVVSIKWDKNYDIDLHIQDPTENHYYFAMPRYDNNPESLLTTDMEQGPGVEVFESTHAQVGKYIVAYDFFKYLGNYDGEVTILGSIYYRDGVIRIPEKILTESDIRDVTQIGVITVSENGEVSFSSN